jgi:thioredoxin reductase (NADPH)
VYETVVGGGGVAGLTAALFAARHGLRTLVLISDVPGGQLANIEHIEDFPGFPQGIAGYDLGPLIQEQAAGAGAEFRMGAATGLRRGDDGWLLETDGGDVETKTVVLAAGSHPRPLSVPGAERLLGKGVSTCASCDGPLLRGGPAAVIGGGDSAFQEAITVAGFAGAVHVLFPSDQPEAQDVYRQRVSGLSAITLHPCATVEEILGSQIVEGVLWRDSNSGQVAETNVDAVFIYTGLEPNMEFLRNALDLDPAGHIPTDIWMRTQLPGVFAAGDIRSNSASQAVSAAGDGATAAIAAFRFLRGADAGTW